MKNIKFILTFIFATLIYFEVKSNELVNNDLLVGLVGEPPFVIIDNDVKKGITVELWTAIADSLNIEYQFVTLNPKNTVADIAETNVNLSVTPFEINKKNIDSIFLSQPFFISSMSVAVDNQYESGVITFVDNLFSFSFLKTIGLLLLINLIIGIVMWIAEHKNNASQFPKNLSGLGDGFWWSWVTMTTVGYGDKVPQSAVGRIVGTIWMFTAVIIISSFTASITTELTTKRLANKVNKFSDLYDMKVGCVKNSNSAYYLDYKDVTYKSYPNVEDGMAALHNGEIKAFVEDDVILKYYLKDVKNELFQKISITDLSGNKVYYCFSASDAELINRINYYLMRIIESEEWGRILKNY